MEFPDKKEDLKVNYANTKLMLYKVLQRGSVIGGLGLTVFSVLIIKNQLPISELAFGSVIAGIFVSLAGYLYGSGKAEELECKQDRLASIEFVEDVQRKQDNLKAKELSNYDFDYIRNSMVNNRGAYVRGNDQNLILNRAYLEKKADYSNDNESIMDRPQVLKLVPNQNKR